MAKQEDSGMDPTEDQLAARSASPEMTTKESFEYATPAPNNSAGAQGSPYKSPTNYMPGVVVDQSRFVVLASRLGRMMEALPKHDPKDDNEPVRYAVPEAYERGEIIGLDDIWRDPTGKVDNLGRLLRTGAIGFLDHPDARGASESLRYRRDKEAEVMADRGIVSR